MLKTNTMIISFRHIFPFLVFIFLGIIFSQPVSAVPAYPHPVEYTQPDGQKITIHLKGDEKVSWAESETGHTILVNKSGEYQYANQDEQGNLVFSGIKVSPAGQKNLEETELLQELPKGLFFSEEQVSQLKSVWEIREKSNLKAFPTTGNRTLLAILMETPDIPFTRTQEEFDALFNQVNYTIGGASGSVKDYYLENSYGLLNLTVDVAGPYTAENNMAYYADDARPLFTEGIAMADEDVDFADYDNDNDGLVDAIYMIFAGYGEEAGGGPNTIWSHAWGIWPGIEYDGVLISRYACSPEMRGNSSNNPSGNISRIGVIAHEFGHSLGAPDYYDTNYGTGGQFQGTGRWDIMSGGAWNDWGATPAHHSGFTKVTFYDWAEATELNTPQSITLNNAAEHSDSFYKIITANNDEYFFIENRHKHLFDSYIPGSGMLIYHIHEDALFDAQYNTINTTHPQKVYPVSANAFSDPNNNPSSYGNINQASCAWTGNNGKTEFSDMSTPSSLSWNGENTNKPIFNISQDFLDKTISFDFIEEPNQIYTADFYVTDHLGNPIEGALITILPENINKKNGQWLYAGKTNEKFIYEKGNLPVIKRDKMKSFSLESAISAEANKAFVHTSKNKSGTWLHWDSSVNHGSMGLTSEGLITAATRWTPPEISELEGQSVKKVNIYINDLPESCTIKIWQGDNESSLVQVYSETVTVESQQWNEIILDEPVLINTSQELWIAYQVFDPGEDFYPLGRDTLLSKNWKGNLFTTGNSSDWNILSEYNIKGNWNLQAFVDYHEEEPVTITTDNNGFANIELIEGFYSFEAEKDEFIKSEGDLLLNQENTETNITLYPVAEFNQVTFRVNMTWAQGFDPEQHDVYLTGSFNEWAEPGTQASIKLKTSDTKNQEFLIYEALVPIADGDIEFKYFSDMEAPGWDGGEWDGSPNRSETINSDVQLDHVWGYLEQPILYDLTLTENIEDAGEMTGQGLYPEDIPVNITAKSNPGYFFLHLKNEDTGEILTNLPYYSFTMQAENTEVRGYFTDESPVASVNTEGFNLNMMHDESTTVGFDLSNTGNSLMYYEITPDNNVDWITIQEYDGLITGGNSNYVEFNISTENLIEGVYTSQIEITTNDINNNIISIPVTVNVTGEPELSLAIDSIDFGSVRIKQIFSEPIGIQNTGTGTLVLNDIVFSSNYFFTNQEEISIAPNSTEFIMVSFSSETGGIHQGNMTFSTNIEGEVNNVILLEAFIPTYELTIRVEPPYAGSASGSGSFPATKNITVQANPAEGYEFTNWSNEEDVVLWQSSAYNFSMPSESFTLVANFSPTTNISNLSDDGYRVSVFPNPARESLTISAEFIPEKITMTDLSGKRIISLIPESDNLILPLDEFQQGIYLIHITSTKQTHTRKISVLR